MILYAEDYSGIASISLDGFQLVGSQLFSKQIEPSMTIWASAIGFNMASFTAMNKCEHINIYVNPAERKILIRPSLSKNPEAVKWVKNIEKPSAPHIECTKFTRPIYEEWGFPKENHYRAYGKLVQCDKKVMLMFDFAAAEVWQGQKMVHHYG